METEETNITALPDPTIVEEVSFEALFEARKQHLVSINSDYALAIELESDPLTVDLQVNAYREYILRQRVNLAGQARLLAKATSGDLDHLGDFYGLVRRTNETDANYRLRIRERIQGSSTAGSSAHYRTRANEAAPAAIRDIAVDSPEGGLVRISIQPKHDFCWRQNSAIADLADFNCADFCTEQEDLTDREGHRCPNLARMGDELSTVVKDHVNDESIKMLTDTVIVQQAEKVGIDVRAEIKLNPTTPKAVFDQIKKDFVEKWDHSAEMGWDVAPSWILRHLHQPGVYDVKLTSPADVVPILSNQTARIAELELVLMEGGSW